MIRPAHMIYALALLLCYEMLFGPRPEGLVPGGIILGLWAFVFYSDYRPRAMGIVAMLLILGCGCLSLLMPLHMSGHGNAHRSFHCRNNLKLIGLALHNYSAEHGSFFPPAYIANENGKPLLSWRVLLLPYLDRADLYQKFDLTKPWDSPENLELQEYMPGIYACPSHHSFRPKPTTTSYVAIVGPRSAWRGSSTMSGDNLGWADGEGNIIMVIEHHSDIAWTEPRDLNLDEAVSILASTDFESFGGHRSETFFEETFLGRAVLFADGSVQFAPFNLEETLAKQFLIIDDQKPDEGWNFSTANNPPAARTKWRNVILFWTCVFFTLLPLPWVWIHPHGGQKREQARADEPLNHSSGHRPKGGPP